MKKLNLLFTALLLMCCVGTAKAVEVTIDGIKYDVIAKGKQATIIDCDSDISGDFIIPSEITYNNVTCNVTSIGYQAFYGCSGLTSITIPNSVTSIGDEAFDDCTALTNIVIPSSVTSIGKWAFATCPAIETIVVDSENNVYDSRNNCNAIIETATNKLVLGCKNTVVPNDVTAIGYAAFDGCTGLTQITIPNSVTSIGEYAFQGCGLTSITIPNSVTSIGNSAFYYCDGLKTVINLSNLTFSKGSSSNGYIAYYANKVYNAPNGSIEGDYIFGKPTNVNTLVAYLGSEAELTLPADYKGEGYAIGESAFNGNNTITSITIPNSVTSIGEAAFDDCTALTNIVIPSSVTSIGKWAFATCPAIESIVVDSENNVYDSRNNCNAIIETATNKLVLGCKNTVVPNDVTAIGYGAFDGCTGLTQITIPNSVTSIGEYAFAWCGLTSITIPNSVTSIGENAFWGCSGLKTVINLSNLTFSKGSTDYGYIARYADNVYNAPNGSIEGDYIFGKPTNVNTLVAYLGSEAELTLPADYKGESYVIGASAFNGNNTITSITIPNSVTSIGNQAFSNCDNLTDVHCLATNVPSTNSNAFSGSYPEYMTLHVPAEAINSYKTTEPWSTFGNIIVYVTPKCAAPVFEYRNGELIIECQTKNAEFVTTITNDYTGNYNSNAIALTATYNISVYATATGYDNSDTVNATLCWIECDCSANDNTTDVINVPAKAVFVTSNNGTININCALEGQVVELYTSDAMHIGSTTIENGCATIESGLSKGDIAIIKIAEKSIKVILN